MKVLFLDDDKTRWLKFKPEFIGALDRVTWVETAAEAVAALDAEEWTFVFLDHDLGGEHYVDSANKNTGAEVTRHLRRQAMDSDMSRFGKTLFCVHSFNPEGAMNMHADLVGAGLETVVASFNGSGFWGVVHQAVSVLLPDR